MKTQDKVIITSGIYKGADAIITGFEHLNIKDDVVTVDNNPKDCSRVELQSDRFKHYKLYFPVREFDLLTLDESEKYSYEFKQSI